jgi:membrane-bound lytic murein transglycosylase D
MLIKSGSTLLVPRTPRQAADVPQQVADHGAIRLAPEPRPPRRVELRAGRQGETVAAVARRHGVSAANVARWNDVSTQARFAPGARIVVYLPPRAATTRSAARPATRGASSTRATPPRRTAAQRAPAARQAAARTRPAPARPTAAQAPRPVAAARAEPSR